MTASTRVSSSARRRWVLLLLVPLGALVALSTLRACAGRADERATCTPEKGTIVDRQSLTSYLAGGLGWIEVGGMTFREAGFIVRTEKIATFSRVTPLRPVPGEDHSRGRVYEALVPKLRAELAADATIAVQLVPTAEKEMYALQTVALRRDGTLRWIEGCDDDHEVAEFDVYVAERARGGDARSAVELFRALVSGPVSSR